MSNDFEDYDMNNIDNEVARYQPPERASERGRARALVPLIARMIAQRSDLTTAAVRRIIDANRRSGPLPTTATFNREFGKICREERGRVRQATAKAPLGGGRKSTSIGTATAQPAAKTPRVVEPETATPTVSMRAQEPLVSNEPARVHDTRHPREIYAGTFGGKVYVHGPAIRAFFNAIEVGTDDVALVRLARAVMADTPSRANLVQLHKRDRAVLDAALLLS